MKALVVGGVMDGQVVDMDPLPSHINGMALPRLRLSDVAVSTAQPPTRQHYERTEVAVFGLNFPIFVLKDWPQERMEATLSAMLLTPLAHTLAGESS